MVGGNRFIQHRLEHGRDGALLLMDALADLLVAVLYERLVSESRVPYGWLCRVVHMGKHGLFLLARRSGRRRDAVTDSADGRGSDTAVELFSFWKPVGKGAERQGTVPL